MHGYTFCFKTFTSFIVCLFLLSCIRQENRTQAGLNLDNPPQENRFTKTVLVKDLKEPMELAVTKNHRVFFVERKGNVKLYNPVTDEAKVIGKLDVFSGNNDGLLGIALDPDFYNNQHIYLYYSPAGDPPRQRLSRFMLKDNQLDIGSEKVMLEIPTQRETCCHSAGSLEFGPKGLLYIATGDNTNPWESDGYSPLDERKEGYDAQQTSANTNDLRGKILRIRPLPDGTYEIPDGNLFPKDGSQGRPEIYAMGIRNPFRISVDSKNSYIYFGDIGPDASQASEKGPNSYDELNVVKEPGNYGWPYFIADNKAYPEINFTTGEIGEMKNPEKPVNDSPNNTGQEVLPPAKPAMLYYSYSESEQWPALGKGGRSIMAGEVYHFHDYKNAVGKFPLYYDNYLFIYEWMRNWIKVVRLDENGDVVKIEDFMPSTPFEKPMDMQFAPDGSLYVLEYGSAWYSDNSDAKLSRISYTRGNRPPVAKIEVSASAGAVPLTVEFSADSSYDADNDSLQYAWSFLSGEEVDSQEKNPTFIFDAPGEYQCTLVVTDAQGEKSSTYTEIIVGNAPPKVNISIEGNRTFYWPDEPIAYRVSVTDQEDGSISRGTIRPESVQVFWDRNIGENISPIITGHQEATSGNSGVLIGESLIDQNDCKNCHMTDGESIGPSYKQIAERYEGDTETIDKLANKIITGGGGVWDKNFVMVGHPDLSKKAATQIVGYILSLAEGPEEHTKPLKVAGKIQPESFADHGLYRITAKYEDHGGSGVGSLTDEEYLVLRPPYIQAESFNEEKNLRIGGEIEDGDDRYIENIKHGSYVVYKATDLTRIDYINFRYASGGIGGQVQLRLDSPEGQVMGEVELANTGGWQSWQEQSMQIASTTGVHDLYVIFINQKAQREPLFNIDWLYFGKNWKLMTSLP